MTRPSILAAALLLSACHGCTPEPSPVPPPQPAHDGGFAGAAGGDSGADAGASCGLSATPECVCQHLAHLGCLPDGGDCVGFVTRNQSGPVLGRLDLAACVRATTCEECR